jgi:hypothetical protein
VAILSLFVNAPLRVRGDAIECVRWVSRFDLRAVSREIEFVSLRHPHEYPMNEGRIGSTRAEPGV